ncbi:MAG: MATE family efflux transporter [Acidimicrobiales bacterium]
MSRSPRPGNGAHVLRRSLKIGLPALGTVLLEPILTSTDSAFMGHLGLDPLAALGLSTSLINLVVVPLVSVGLAVTSVAARSSVDVDERTLQRLGATTASAFALLGLVVGVLLGVGGTLVVAMVAPNHEIGLLAGRYLVTAAFGLPALFFVEGGAAYRTGRSQTGSVFAITALTVTINLTLETVLVFGLHLSVVGSALGTDSAQGIAALIYLYYLRSSEHWSGRERWRAIKTFALEFRRASLDLFLRTLALIGALSGSAFLAATYSGTTLSSFQLAEQLWLLIGLSFDAIAVPAQVLTGEWSARRDHDAIVYFGPRFVGFGAALSVILGVGIYELRHIAPSILTSVPVVADQTGALIVLLALVMPLTAVSFVIDGLLAGLERFDLLRTIMVVSFIAFVLVALLLRSLTTLVDGEESVWSAFTVWLAVRTLLSSVLWWRSRPSSASG